MTKTREAFTTPVGRIVQGDVFVAQTKDQQGNLRTVKSGPNIGQPAPQFFVAVAIPKLNPSNPAEWNPEWLGFMSMLYRAATTEWPTMFNAATPDANVFGILAKPPVNPVFTFKVKDGDGLDRNGKSNAEKEGFPGHWIVSFASSYAPKVVRPSSPGVWETLTWEPNSGTPCPVKRGYYVRVAGSVTGNDSPNTPGLYVNLDMIELVGHGPEIIGGPDAASAFATPAALPPGASAIPMATSGAMPAATPPVPGAPASPPAPAAAAAIPSPAAVSSAPANPAAPGYTGYMGVPGAEAGAPAAPLVAPSPAVTAPPPSAPSVPPVTISPSRAMTAKAGGATYESFVGAGWTDAQMIEQGFMTA